MYATDSIRLARLPRLSAWSSTAAIGVSLLISLLLLFFLAGEMDRSEMEHSERFTSALLDDQTELVERALGAMSSWRDASSQYQPAMDTGWAFDKLNLGAMLQSNFNIDLIMIFDGRGNEVRTVEAGEVSTRPIASKIEGDVGKLVSLARAQSVDDPPAHGYGLYQGCPVLLAAAPLRQTEYAVGFRAPPPNSVLVFGLRLTPNKLDQLGRKLFVEGLRVAGSEADAGGLPRHAVAILGGTHTIVFRWKADQPGRRIVTYVLPGLIIGFAVMAIWLILLMRHNRESTIEIALASARLVTAHRNAEFRATHDMMTGLANRVRLTVTLERLLKSDERMAILFIDLDRFKPINDCLGHEAGDKALQVVASRLLELGGLIAARVGGDEFVVVLDLGLRDEAYLGAFCRDIIDLISTPIPHGDSEMRVGASIGVSLAPEHSTIAVELLRYADIALYEAKEVGRGTFRIFSPAMNARILQRRVVEDDLRLALRNREFQLYYQPRVDAHTLEITSMEALIRWNHPRKGLVSPSDFIPIAEDVGLIVPIGEWVLQEACRMAAGMDLPVSVNISAVQLRHSSLLACIADALATTGLPPDHLEVELTETALLEATDSARVTVDELKALGVKLAMDDFGTGYASIGYLRTFRFDVLKIDRQFVVDLSHSSETRDVIDAMISLGQAMGLLVVVEGVETAEQLAILAARSGVEVQGYHTGRPCSADDIRALLSDNRRNLGRSFRDGTGART